MQQTDGSPDSVCLELEKLLEGKTHLLIIVHNTPDPDAVASAAALSFAVEKKTGVQTSIAYGGSIGRAENREMIRRLCIKMKQIGKISLAKYDSLAVVDTQPGAGNAQLPPGLPVQIVIDHHPRREDLSAAYYRIEPDIGATSTLLVELLKECGIEPPADLATALAFGITTETQSLARETEVQYTEAGPDHHTDAQPFLLRGPVENVDQGAHLPEPHMRPYRRDPESGVGIGNGELPHTAREDRVVPLHRAPEKQARSLHPHVQIERRRKQAGESARSETRHGGRTRYDRGRVHPARRGEQPGSHGARDTPAEGLRFTARV